MMPRLALNSWAQAILQPQPLDWLGLQRDLCAWLKADTLTVLCIEKLFFWEEF
jgi:hypothetical protein